MIGFLATLSAYLRDYFVDEMFGDRDFTPPSTLEISLHDGPPGTTGANEFSGNNYGRASSSPSDWGDVDNNTKENTSEILFNQLSGTFANQATHFGVWDGSGNFLGGDDLNTHRDMVQGATPRFKAGTLTWSIT